MIDLRVKLPGFVKEVVHRVSVVLVKRSKVEIHYNIISISACIKPANRFINNKITFLDKLRNTLIIIKV